MNELSLNRSLSRFAVVGISLVAVALLAIFLRFVLVQLFVAIIIAAGMSPLVAAMTDPERTRGWRWRPPRALAVLLIYMLSLVLLAVIGAILVRAMAAEGEALVVRLPQSADEFQAWLDEQTRTNPLLQQLGFGSVAPTLDDLERYVLTFVRQLATAASWVAALFGGAITALFVLFMALYMTVDKERMLDYVVVFIPGKRQAQARTIVQHISTRLGAWVIGQFVLCVAIGIGAWIGLAIIGVPGAALLGVIWAVAEFIPGIGPFISAVPTILLGFSVDPTVGLLSAVFSVVWSQVANNVVLPRVMSSAVKLNPLIVLLALLIGSELLGLIGAIISIPAAAALAVIIDEIRNEHIANTTDDGQLVTTLGPGQAHMEQLGADA